MSIGETIKNIRIQKKMTQKDLGEKIGGIPQQQIGRWENGKVTPKLDTIQKIAVALDIDINDLLESTIIDKSPVYRAFKNSKYSNSELAREFMNGRLIEGIDWEPVDIELLKIFKTLNKTGQAIAIERVEELTEIPRYTEEDSDSKV